MKKPGKYLKFYLRYVESGVMSSPGLCNCFYVRNGGNDDKKIGLFKPLHHTEARMAGHSALYWGGGVTESGKNFNAFRQNVVLFCAAMNNEL